MTTTGQDTSTRPNWWVQGAHKVGAAARELEGMFDWEKVTAHVHLDDQLAEILQQIDGLVLANVRVDEPELADQIATIRADCRRLLVYAREEGAAR